MEDWKELFDNHWYYIGLLITMFPICFGFGLLIGWIIS